MIRAYLFALDPTDAQAEQFRSHCGGQRFAYNWGLAQVKANLGQREAERSYGIAEDDLTPSMSWSAYSFFSGYYNTLTNRAVSEQLGISGQAVGQQYRRILRDLYTAAQCDPSFPTLNVKDGGEQS